MNQQKRWPFAADLNDDQIHKIWCTMFDIYFFPFDFLDIYDVRFKLHDG